VHINAESIDFKYLDVRSYIKKEVEESLDMINFRFVLFAFSSKGKKSWCVTNVRGRLRDTLSMTFMINVRSCFWLNLLCLM